jgi:hypothetical protein
MRHRLLSLFLALALGCVVQSAHAWEYFSGCVSVNLGDPTLGVSVSNFTMKKTTVRVRVYDCSVNPASVLGDSGNVVLEPEGEAGHELGFVTPAGAQVQIRINTSLRGRLGLVIPSAVIFKPGGVDVDIRLMAGDFQRY